MEHFPVNQIYIDTIDRDRHLNKKKNGYHIISFTSHNIEILMKDETIYCYYSNYMMCVYN